MTDIEHFRYRKILIYRNFGINLFRFKPETFIAASLLLGGFRRSYGNHSLWYSKEISKSCEDS